MTPIEAYLAGRDGKEFVFLVDWKRLSEEEQTQCLEYMAEKFSAEPSVIRETIASMGYFPIQHEYIIESYDMQHFM